MTAQAPIARALARSVRSLTPRWRASFSGVVCSGKGRSATYPSPPCRAITLARSSAMAGVLPCIAALVQASGGTGLGDGEGEGGH